MPDPDHATRTAAPWPAPWHLGNPDTQPERDEQDERWALPPDVVVVHGPWQLPSWWQPLQHVMAEGRRRCWVPELPGGDRHDPSCLTVTLEDLAATVIAAIESIDQPQDLTLVVHGLAGPVGQLVASAVPQSIGRIVWINALVLDRTPGGLDHLADQLGHHLQSLVVQAEHEQPVPMDLLTWSAFFAQDASDEGYEAAAKTITNRVCPPGWLAHDTDVSVFWDLAATRAWDQVYLHCLDDRVVTYERQLDAVERLRPDRTAAVAGSHTHAFARPDVIAAALLDLCHAGLAEQVQTHWAAVQELNATGPLDQAWADSDIQARQKGGRPQRVNSSDEANHQ